MPRFSGGEAESRLEPRTTQRARPLHRTAAHPRPPDRVG